VDDELRGDDQAAGAAGEHLYLNSNEHLRQSNEVETREERKNAELRAQFPLAQA
jgi:hypothetical protein